VHRHQFVSTKNSELHACHGVEVSCLPQVSLEMNYDFVGNAEDEFEKDAFN